MIKRTFKDKALDIIRTQMFYEEGKFHNTGDIRHIHRMEMCDELGEAIEALIEPEEKNEGHTDRD